MNAQSVIYWAKFYGITRQVITRACKRGDVPGAYQSGSAWFIPQEAIEAAVESGAIRLKKGRPKKVLTSEPE